MTIKAASLSYTTACEHWTNGLWGLVMQYYGARWGGRAGDHVGIARGEVELLAQQTRPTTLQI